VTPVPAASRWWRLVIAVDGKVERGARLADGRQVHLLSAYDTSTGIVLAQVQIAVKSNEIVGTRRVPQRPSRRGSDFDQRRQQRGSGINGFLVRSPPAPPPAARRGHISRPPGLPRTTRDNRSQLPHSATNHDHGLAGPGQARRTRRRSPYGRSCHRSVVIVHIGGRRTSMFGIADKKACRVEFGSLKP
jgi:hypothetical protein